MEKSFPRFGYPNLDALMASAERGFAGNFDFLFSHAKGCPRSASPTPFSTSRAPSSGPPQSFPG